MSSVERRQSGIVQFDTATLTSTHWVVIGLAALSGVIHLYLYSTEQYLPFLLAGLGFIGAIILLIILPAYRKYLYPLGALFVLAQLAGYVAIGTAFDTPIWLDAVDKIAQVLLVIILARLTYHDWT